MTNTFPTHHALPDLEAITQAEQFSLAVQNLSHVWRLALDRRMKDFGLNRAGWMTIAVVARSQAPISQIEISNHLGVEGATMVSTLDRLQKAGLVIRQPSPDDRRVKHVELTHAGSEVYKRLKKVADSFRQEILAGVNKEDLLQATSVLERVRQFVEEQR